MNDASPPESPSLTRRRRTFLAPLWLMWLLAMGAFAILLGLALTWHSATATTIVLVRHAEKEIGAISDAPLSPEGEQRADRLAQMLGDADDFGRIRRIYVTNTRRTQQTALRLSQRLGITSEVVDAKTESKDLARRVLAENRGGRALIVGHSNTVPEIVQALTKSKDVPPIGENEYDTLYVVTVPSFGPASILRMKY
ncbi:MAG TPA: phosphoglycerate mutase family protein [Steroidobacteraceae bacterium]|nr:phosphoglycerate mutase family protein [Steroidobacteraceae bacterium]